MVLSEVRAPVLARRERLLEVARDIFAERGYRATTMDDVAAAAGFTKPILYQHFTSKEALYNEIVERTSDELLAALADATAHAEGPRDMVERAFSVFFASVMHDTAAYRLLFLQPPVAEGSTVRRRIESRITDFIESRIPLHQNSADRRRLAASLVGMAEGAATAWLVQQEHAGWPQVEVGEADRLAALVATLAWGGLRTVRMD